MTHSPGRSLRLFRIALSLVFSVALISPVLVSSPKARAASPPPVRAKNGMVASTEELASRVGVEVLKRGGNAVDAAIAVGLALAVTYPRAGNIGGGGFMVIRMADGRTAAIDYRETAPAAATSTMYQDKAGNVVPGLSTETHLAAGVPGTVAGFALAREKFGTLKWAELVEPARKLAADGIEVTYSLERSLQAAQKLLGKFPESKRVFLKNGDFLKEGDLFKQPELAATLARIRDKGPREFYEGETAKLIAAEMKKNGGIMTYDDLKAYQPKVRDVLKGSYRGYDILTMPPPSSGGVALLEMLNMLEKRDIAADGFGTTKSYHWMVEAMRRAFADRAEFMGDPDFTKVPTAGLISKKYAEGLYASINPDKASTSKEVRFGRPPGDESLETTHYTVIDKAGNVVSNTYTLNGSYGCGVTVAGTGILLNNEMDDFAAKVGVPNAYQLIQGEANLVGPKKRPLSAMTPTIVMKDGKVLFAVGSPGGPTIINTVFQVIVNVIDHKMNIQEAIDAPRIHHQWLPDAIIYEPNGVNPDVKARMEAMGHRFLDTVGFDAQGRPRFMGDAHGIMIEPKTGILLGASDPRNYGKTVGY